VPEGALAFLVVVPHTKNGSESSKSFVFTQRHIR
jgi:hypothetical protein